MYLKGRFNKKLLTYKFQKKTARQAGADERFENNAAYKDFPVKPFSVPITSLEAVVNNSVGPDGVRELTRLLGGTKQIILITKKQAQEIDAYMKKIDGAGMREGGANFMKALQDKQPDLWGIAKSVNGFEFKIQRIMFDALDGKATMNSDDNYMIMTVPGVSFKEYIAGIWGISLENMPKKEPLGSDLLFQARTILHEVAHAMEHASPKNIGNYVKRFSHFPKNTDEWAENSRESKQYSEINSDYAALRILNEYAKTKPFSPENPEFIDPGYQDYFIAVRRITTLNGHVKNFQRYGLTGKFDHHTSSALERLGLFPTIEDVEQFVEEGLYNDKEAYQGLVHKIRAELGAGPDKALYPYPSIEKQAEIVKWLMDEGNLNSDETVAGKAFVESVSTVGYEIGTYDPKAIAVPLLPSPKP